MGVLFTDPSLANEIAGSVWIPDESALPPVVVLTLTGDRVTAVTLPPSAISQERRYTSPWETLPDAHANLLRLGYRFGAEETMPNIRDGGGRLLTRSIKATYRLVAVGKLDLSHVETVAIADIVLDNEVQSRLALDPAAVERYRDEYVAGARFPAVILFREKQGAPLILADGFHRVEAARQANIVRIAAIILRGGRRAAQLYAASANLRHGVRPTHDDASHTARRMLLDQEWRSWSDREIARRTGLSHTSVGKLRAALEAEGAIAPAPARTYTRAGKTQAMDTASIGAAPATFPLVGTPNGASASPPLHAMERGQGGEDESVAAVPLSDFEKSVLDAFLDYMTSEAKTAWVSGYRVFPDRSNLGTSQRKALQRLADKGLLEKHPKYIAYRPKAAPATLPAVGTPNGASTSPPPHAMESGQGGEDESLAHSQGAFSACQIVEARIAALRSRAVLEIRLLTESGRLYAQRANQLAWNETEGVAEFYPTGNPDDRITLGELTIADFAQVEHLNYRLSNGSIFYWSDPITALYPLLAPPPVATPPPPAVEPPASPSLPLPEKGQEGEVSPLVGEQDDDDHKFVSRPVSSAPPAPPPLHAVERGQGGEVSAPPPSRWQQQRAAAAAQRQQRAADLRDTPGTRMRAELAACGIEASQIVAHVNGRTGEFTAAFDFAHVYDDERDARRAAARYATRIVRAGYDLLDCGVDIDATMTIASIRTPMVCFKEPSQ